jgi:ammonium transporter, Amt family
VRADLGRSLNPGGADGLFAGGSGFFAKQTAVLGASAWAFGFTYGMLVLINKLTPVKVTEDEEARGLDTVLHSEQAYDLGAG